MVNPGTLSHPAQTVLGGRSPEPEAGGAETTVSRGAHPN